MTFAEKYLIRILLFIMSLFICYFSASVTIGFPFEISDFDLLISRLLSHLLVIVLAVILYKIIIISKFFRIFRKINVPSADFTFSYSYFGSGFALNMKENKIFIDTKKIYGIYDAKDIWIVTYHDDSEYISDGNTVKNSSSYLNIEIKDENTLNPAKISINIPFDHYLKIGKVLKLFREGTLSPKIKDIYS